MLTPAKKTTLLKCLSRSFLNTSITLSLSCMRKIGSQGNNHLGRGHYGGDSILCVAITRIGTGGGTVSMRGNADFDILSRPLYFQDPKLLKRITRNTSAVINL